MQTISEIRAILAERALRPKHRLGQNFLHDQNQLRRLVGAAALSSGDLVVEVGPGTGTLTETLLDAGCEVIACELDPDMASIIEDRLGDRLTLVRGDCLGKGRTLSPDIVRALAGRPFTLVANLPYQAASPLMSSLLIEPHGCRGQYVTIQKEVADRLLAEPGTKAYGPLTIIVRALGDVERIANVPASCFWPAPQVVSAMVAITPRETRLTDRPAAFARFVTSVFTKRRKQLGAIFGRAHAWPAGVEATMRPEALTPAQLAALHEVMGDDGMR